MFTTNYDPIIYWNIFDDNKDSFFTGGFKGGEKIDIDTIKERFNTNAEISIYYLHGTFHIFQENGI